MLKKSLLIVGFCLLVSAGIGQTQGGDQGTGGLTAHQQNLRARAMAATQRFLDPIGRHASEYGVEPALIMAVITVESDGDPNSLSGAGAMGLMQLMPETCVDYGVDQPYDPDSNIRGGTAMLANHMRRYHGDLQKVLAAYNAGIRHADDGSWVNIGETRRYVPTVLAIYEVLKGTAEIPTYSEPTQAPVLPPEQNIDATPAIPTVDLMFQALRWAPNIPDPAGLAESSKLDDAAGTLLTEYQAGRLSQTNLQKRAAHAIAAEGRHPKSLKAYCLSTSDLSGFSDEWNKQSQIQGHLVGLAHGLSRQGHVWIVLVAA